MSTASSGIKLFGSGMQGVSNYNAGKENAASLREEAASLDAAAGQELTAASQRSALINRSTDLTNSRVKAVVGASGTAVSSDGVQDIINDNKESGLYDSLVALRDGRINADNMRRLAKGRRETAAQTSRAADTNFITSILGGL